MNKIRKKDDSTHFALTDMNLLTRWSYIFISDQLLDVFYINKMSSLGPYTLNFRKNGTSQNNKALIQHSMKNGFTIKLQNGKKKTEIRWKIFYALGEWWSVMFFFHLYIQKSTSKSKRNGIIKNHSKKFRSNFVVIFFASKILQEAERIQRIAA